MQRYKYIHLGNGISKKAEREYNQLCRYEQYQKERDEANGLMYYDDENLNMQIVDETTLPIAEEISKADKLWNERRTYLPCALNQLKSRFPDDYSIIYDYYLSGEKIGLKRLAVQHGVTHQMMSKRIAKARDKLKNLIIMHEKQS